MQLLMFDVFGTVVDWRSGIITAGTELGARHGLEVDWAAFADSWRGEYQPSMDRVRRGEVEWMRLDELHRESLRRLLPRFGIRGLAEAELDAFNRAWHRLPAWPDAVEGLSRLRGRFTLAAMSNGNLSLLTNLAKYAALPWDCILSAELVRHYKPDPEAYLSGPRFFDLDPEQVMMVATHLDDLIVPRRLGLPTAYVHRPYEHPAKGDRRPAAGTHEFIVDDLVELAQALGA